MNKSLVAALIVILLILIGGSIYLTHRNNTGANNPARTTTNASGSSSNSGSQNATATDKVTIANFAFSPANITVKKGTTVTWTNNDSTTHTIVESDSQTGPASGSLAPGSSYSFTYSAAGTYPYHCSIHPDMIGTVVVTE